MSGGIVDAVRLARARRFSAIATWYLTPDHLLLADERQLRVSYRRFYYADIRSVVAWPDARWWWRAGLMPLVAASLSFCAAATAMGIWNLATRQGGTMREAGAVAAVAALLTAAVQVAMGSFVRTRIETSYGTCEVPLTGRWRSAAAPLRRLGETMSAALAEREA